jgi:hypothetical protein
MNKIKGEKMSVQGLTLIKINDKNKTNPKYINASSISTIEQVPAGIKLSGLDNNPISIIKTDTPDKVLDKLEKEGVVGKVLDLTV